MRRPFLPHETDAEIETLAAALLAAAERNPAERITDRGKALAYHRAEAMRRLDLLRQRARDATSGDDPERAAIQAEEHAPLAKAHAETVAGLLRAASPLAGTPGARPCRQCGRGVWTSPTWQGAQPPNLCAACFRETAP